MTSRQLLVSSLSLLAVCAATSVHAQTPPATAEAADGNDIIVTARLTRERLQDVPISVTSVNAEELSKQGINSFRDIASKVAGFSFETLQPLIPQSSIRGQVNLRTDSPVTNVAYYLDGIYLQRAYLVDQKLIDVSRIEVIKGPQSALYGRNSFAGAINMTTREPSLDAIEASVSGTVGNYDRYEARGRISVPLMAGRLAVSVAGGFTKFDGSWANAHPLANSDTASTKGRIGGYDNWAVQGQVKWKLTDTLTFTGLWIHTQRDEETLAGYSVGTSTLLSPFNTLNASPRPGLTPPFTVQNRLFVGEFPATPIVAAGDTTRPAGLLTDPRAFGVRGPTDLASAKLEWAPDSGPFSAVAYQFGYSRAKVFGRGSPQPNPLSPVIVALPPAFIPVNFGTIFDESGTDSSFKGFSHDLKFTLAGNDWWNGFFGVNYSRTRDIASNATSFAPANTMIEPNPALLFPVGPGLPFPSNLFQRTGYLQRDENILSGYFFLKVRPADDFEATFEGRYTNEDQKALDLLTREPTNAAVQALLPPRFAQTISYFTPRVTLTYKFSSNNNIYASVARGVKAGGLNGNTPFAGQRAYGSEKNWTYEIGTKNSFMDGALTLNLAAFHTDWSNLQTSVVRLAANGTAPSFFAIVPSTVGNIGGVSIWGVEGDLSWRVAEPLRLFASASYNRSRYKDGSFSQRFGASGNCDGTVCATQTVAGQPTAVLSVSGNQLERVPDFNAVGGFSLDTSVGDGVGLFLRGDVTYKSKQYMDEANLSFVPGRTLFNASAGFTAGGFDVTFWMKNIGDKKYVSTALFLIGTNGALSASYVPVLGERRTFGVTGGFKF
ncbi:TonB-dependent receptor [Sandaracinobacteroides saxicola]|uniref:TonB-dependent receptor n=1 Tax=Sandaracinobacteroides saxicola TaxID=2759707 RepID=A0A7G5ILA1_9SPHN|nr:TonB-dependent receptor [Sandaracinobacteroides saxicola]QMW24143.1 TonB-dependent receptor [Sandaracinobacteroides saxicola]